jgi:hypothetical protein
MLLLLLTAVVLHTCALTLTGHEGSLLEHSAGHYCVTWRVTAAC